MTGRPDPRICDDHLARAAVVYVRQSTPEQVRDNVESTRIQRALVDEAIALGWREPLVIDDDLGVSAAGFADRPGFQQLLTRVALRQVGIILCFDASRLSRNSKDWAHLFELCSYFRTLIADTDQLYDLSLPNDRLVMGIKGTLSEMELGLIRARMRSGVEAKAARGEYRYLLPTGYAHDGSGRIVFDPDQRVQQAIHSLFDRFDEHTSVRQLAMWYRDTKTPLPRKKRREGIFVTVWEVPGSSSLYHILGHPIYAGAYVYGRRRTVIDYHEGKLVKRTQEGSTPDHWRVLIPDHHPAYITWERFMANRARISDNKARWRDEENRGAIREGLAFLTGLLRCGKCGSRLFVGYKYDSRAALYYCDGGNEKASRRCQSFGSWAIDRHVGEELCRALHPLALAASLAAAELTEEERRRAHDAGALRVKALEYDTDRAFEQYDLCDPRNRLVAETLEQRWNEKLLELDMARRELDRLLEREPGLSGSERRRLDELARDFPAVWNHAQADPKLKKRLLREAIREVLVTAHPEDGWLDVVIHWHGGVHTRVHVKKRRRGGTNRTPADLVELVRQLAPICSDAEIARVLNMKRIESARGLTWTEDRVGNFRGTYRISARRQAREDETLTQNQAADYLGISRNGLLGLERLGALSRNQLTDFAPWRVSRSELESQRVQELVRYLKENGRLPRRGSSKGQQLLFPQEQQTCDRSENRSIVY